MANHDKYKVPPGFRQLLEALAREVLRNQPNDIYLFSALFFERLLLHRDAHGILPLQKEADYHNFKHDLFNEARTRGILDTGGGNTTSDAEAAAAVKIQAAFRGFEVRHHPEKYGMQKKHSHSNILERRSEYGAAPSYLTNEPMTETEQKAATRIQAEVRAMQQRKKYEAMKKEMQQAATKIQANFRGYKKRQEYLEQRSNQSPRTHSAMSAQSADSAPVRGPTDEQSAAIKIQAQYKGFKVRQELAREKEAATKIQSAFRGHQARKAIPQSDSGDLK